MSQHLVFSVLFSSERASVTSVISKYTRDE